MGVSFKISKRGTRYKPKPVIQDNDNSVDTSKLAQSNGKDEDAVGLTGSSLSTGKHHITAEDEVSFVLNLYPNGYSIGKPSENESALHVAFQEGSKLLHPYDRTSDGLFAAIESGRLPCGILDDIPCKFVEGALICEVRDYRRCISDPGSNIPSVNGSASVSKVRLKMSLENVVKDIPLMTDDSWTYGELMEVESRIVKVLQPKLCLDAVPRLDRLCENPVSLKLNLGLVGARRRRLRQIPEVTVTSNNRPHGKKICIDRAPESSGYRIGELGPASGDVMSQHIQDNVAAQAFRNQRNLHDSMQGSVRLPGSSPAGQDMSISYADTACGKIESQDGQLSSYSSVNKRARLGSVGPDGVQQRIGSFVDGLQASDVQWRNQLLQQPNARGIQYGNAGLQRYPQLEGVANQDGVKLEKVDPSMLKTDMQMMEAESGHMDPRLQQRFQQPFMRPTFPQAGWNNINQQVEKDQRKEEPVPKRKAIQSPRLSGGAVAQSPLSAKSMDMSCVSMGAQYGAVSGPLGQGQREKAAVTSVGRATSMTSSANDSMQQQHQAQLAAKRRSNSLPKTPIISGVGSPSSVNTMGGPMNASSPSVSTPQLTEQSMLERFAKIEVVAMRHQLNRKKNKVNEFSRKPRAFPSQELLVRLANATNNDHIGDELCQKTMSRSLAGGNMNVCKIRVVNMRPKETMQGFPAPLKTRMIMSEKPNEGTVAMHYGEMEDGDYLNAEDHLPTLPNTHWADMLAAQFCALIMREGYLIDEQVQPRPPRVSVTSNSQPNAPGVAPSNSAVDAQPYPESVSGQTTETKPAVSSSSLSSSANILPSSGMLPPGNSQAVQMSQGLVSGIAMSPRPQQMDTQQQPQQQQLPPQNQPSSMSQQPPQYQRSPLMLPTNNSMPQLNAFGQGSNLPLGNHMANKPSHTQLLQQPLSQQQQQPPAQMQRRMMMGLGPAVGMGNIGNNMVGLGGLGNVMGMGGVRGMGGAGVSSPMGGMPGMGGNMGQSPIGALSQANAISQHLRNGTLNPQTAYGLAQKLKLMQSRGMLAQTQSLAGMSGAARQMQPVSGGLSMLGQSLNRGNISQMQRTAMGQMGQMGMPKLMPGMNVPMNPQQLQLQQQQQQLQQQQLQQLQQQHQQQLQQQQPQQQLMQQQEATSPLQAVLSPQQVGSPSTLGIPQQMNQQLTPQQQASPQQMGQRTPMSPPLSSGQMHPMSAGNPEACPASPALSSQTLGSVGSITNSPMDLQGVNKSNSITNT